MHAHGDVHTRAYAHTYACPMQVHTFAHMYIPCCVCRNTLYIMEPAVCKCCMYPGQAGGCYRYVGGCVHYKSRDTTCIGNCVKWAGNVPVWSSLVGSTNIGGFISKQTRQSRLTMTVERFSSTRLNNKYNVHPCL